MTSEISLLRTRGQAESGRVSMVELLFDLVFVFAVTQLSHTLLTHLTPTGGARVAFLLFAIWWVWIFTSWVTNWLDPERTPVRLCLFVLMFAGLVLSASIPHAFGSRGLEFACAYVFMQVGRTLFFLWAVRRERIGMRRNFQRILLWLMVSAVFWILGGLAQGDTRWTYWLIALALEVMAPIMGFWAPLLGRSNTKDWDVEGNHLAERCSLFVIIALGESLLVTGATFAGLQWDRTVLVSFVIAVLGSLAMWWIYFDSGAERAHHRIVHSSDPGRQARSAYTYLHLLIIGGIILGAVSDEIILVHPHHGDVSSVVVIVGGPLIYLLGNGGFKWIMNDRMLPPLSHMAGIAILLALAPAGLNHWLSPLELAIASTGAMIVVGAWETLAIKRGKAQQHHGL